MAYVVGFLCATAQSVPAMEYVSFLPAPSAKISKPEDVYFIRHFHRPLYNYDRTDAIIMLFICLDSCCDGSMDGEAMTASWCKAMLINCQHFYGTKFMDRSDAMGA